MSERCIGIDPGPIPGIVMLDGSEFSVIQCDHAVAGIVLDALLRDRRCPTTVQIEAFIPGRHGNKAGAASAVTRDLVGALANVWDNYDSTTKGRLGGHWFQVPASGVKPWATDQRLEVAGLLEATRGMRHAKDAARHCLYRAVKCGALPDPLSKEWSNR